MRKYIPLILLAAALILGTAGYIMDGCSFYAALLNGLSMVVLEGSYDPANVLIEISRWLAVLFVLDIVYTLVASIFRASAEDVRIRHRAKKSDAVAVHGDGLLADKLAEELGVRGIRSERLAALKAPCQVLLFSDDAQAVGFFNLHRDELLAAREVYLALDGMNPDLEQYPNVYVFSMAEVCAQLYWADHPVNTPERIALIGEGAYGEALVTQGLLVNIFDVEGGVDYTLYGDFARYCNLHTQLGETVHLIGPEGESRPVSGAGFPIDNNDTLRVSDAPWHACLDELSNCNRIILAGSVGENLETAAALQQAGIRAPLHIRCESASDMMLLQPSATDGGPVAFGTSEQLCTQAIVLQQSQHNAGKICHIAYSAGSAMCDGCSEQKDSALFDEPIESAEDRSAVRLARLKVLDFGTCLSCPRFIKDWRKQSDFTKRSNYAAAAFDGHRMELMEACGAGRDSGCAFVDLPEVDRDRLQEIEHIRWNRYHRLSNWRYAPGEKDKAARTHPYLVPYDSLPATSESPARDYDGDSYITLWLRYR